jgi:curved DNA-binding protein CbpA
MEYINDFKNLELPLGASKEEIKNAYKRLSKKYHPDKNKNCDYSNFIKISESYQRLMNIYNYKIDIEDYEFYITNYISIIKYLYEIIKDKLIENTNNWFSYKNKKVEKTKDIIINLDVNLLDIYNNEIKKVTIKVLRKDTKKKLILKKEDFYISLYNYKEKYIFKEKADDDLLKENGDIIITINILNSDGYYIKNMKDEKYNLYYNMTISLYDYLFNEKFFIKLLNIEDNIIEIDRNNFSSKYNYTIKNKGLSYKNNDGCNKGDLIINIIIKNINLQLIDEYKNDKKLKELVIKYF